MEDLNWQQVETIIDQVLDLPPEERDPFIEKKCNDFALRREVTQLLESIIESEGWLENPREYKEDFFRNY